MLGVLVDLTGLNFTLEVIELVDRQATEEFDAALDLQSGLQKVFVLFFLGAFECHRIVDAPMGGNRRARKNRASLAGIVREGDDEVKMTVGELMPGISDGACRVYPEVFAQNFQSEGMNFAFGSFTGAVNFKVVAAYRTEEKLREDAAL
jgi:hypothetical protein